MRWLTLQQLKSKNPATRLQIVEKLAAAEDAEAIEPLLSVLDDENVDVRKCAVRGLGKLRAADATQPLMALMRDSHPEVRQATATALKQVGDKQAIPVLAAALRDENSAVRYHSMAALESLNWVPRDDTERALRCAALGKLHQAAEYGIAAIDALVLEFRTGVHYKRAEAVEALAKIRDARVVKPLTAALKDEDPNVRTKALEGLSRAGAVEPLISALRDGDSRVRATAVEALGKVPDERSVEALSGLLQDKSAEVRKAAAEALSKINIPFVVDIFLGAIEDPDSDIRQVAVAALGKAKDQRAIAPLVVALTDCHEKVRQGAEAALRCLDPQWEQSSEALKAVPVLESALAAEEYWMRHTASGVLKRIVGEPPAATESSEHEIASVSHRTTQPSTEALPVLKALLRDLDRDLRVAGIYALTQVAGDGAMQEITQLLKDSDQRVRSTAARALEFLKWQPGDEEEQMRWLVASQNWAELAGKGIASVHALTALAEDASPALRRNVAETLGKIGGEPVIEPLMLLLNDGQKAVRTAAAHALVRMSNQLNEAQQLVLGYELAH